MRIAWVQDNSRPHGGAEESCREVVRVGEEMGHDIVGITPQDWKQDVLDKCDAIVVNNYFQFAGRQRILMQHALGKKPYVKYEHDHRELGRPGIAKVMFGKSRLNVFLSPFHLWNHKEALGVDGMALPLAIRTEFFRQVPSVKRVPNTAIVVGGWVRGGKIGDSLRGFMRSRPDLKYTSVGHRIDGAVVVPYRNIVHMPELYSAHEYLVHLPDFWCAGERVIFEAALCGCKVIANGNAGHTSWNFDLENDPGLRLVLDEAPRLFWKRLEERCT